MNRSLLKEVARFLFVITILLGLVFAFLAYVFTDEDTSLYFTALSFASLTLSGLLVFVWIWEQCTVHGFRSVMFQVRLWFESDGMKAFLFIVCIILVWFPLVFNLTIGHLTLQRLRKMNETVPIPAVAVETLPS